MVEEAGHPQKDLRCSSTLCVCKSLLHLPVVKVFVLVKSCAHHEGKTQSVQHPRPLRLRPGPSRSGTLLCRELKEPITCEAD